jgi:2'-5' RNA ligase
MPSRTRTFVAVQLPDHRASRLGKLQVQLTPSLPNARWVAEHQLHTTLAFLGDIDDTELDNVCRTVSEAAAPFSPFEIRLEGLGVFPNPARARNLWVGLTGPGAETLCALQQKIAEALTRARFLSEVERFTPHVTLARFKERHGRGRPAPQAPVGDVLRQYQNWSGGSFDVTEVVTLASVLGPEGPSYSVLARSNLQGGKATTSP